MNELIIDYNKKGFQKKLCLAVAGYAVIFGLFLCVKEVLVNNYKLMFFGALILVILASVLILCITIWKDKPLLAINDQSISVHFADQSPGTFSWSEIKEINIGISMLTIATTNSKQFGIDIGSLKYKDMKEAKSKIIELCENKSIHFNNN